MIFSLNLRKFLSADVGCGVSVRRKHVRSGSPGPQRAMLVIAALLIALTDASAQDPQFSQYYQAPLYLNPGFTGITPGHRLGVNHRIQWPNLPQAFSTISASYDVFLEDIRSGIGVLVMSDRIGSAGWKSTTAGLLYSYKIALTDEIVFSPGLSFRYGRNGLDRSKLRMGDGLAYQGNSLDPKLSDIADQQYMDFGSGFVLYARRLWLGASFDHLNRPNLSVLGEVSRLGMRTFVHGGMKIEIHDRFHAAREMYFTPSFVYRMQGDVFSQLDLGVNFHVDPVSIGAWYRGKPFSKTELNRVDHDAVILFLGLYLKNLTAGYSYDFTVSGLNSASGGAHEISLIYEFRNNNKRKPKKKGLIPCPAFYHRKSFWDR